MMLQRILLLVFLVAVPNWAWACACGCGLFDVGTRANYPTGTGASISLEYDYLDQSNNRSLGRSAPATDNEDKDIRTSFLTAGAQYMFNRKWGVSAQVPYWTRTFRTTDATTGNEVTNTHGSLGDIRINGIYTGFSEDMSVGITFGAKLATGDANFEFFDPDTQIGSGSTDLLLGVYRMGNITESGIWRWFGQLNYDQPIVSKTGYLPGNEMTSAIGAYYEAWSFSENQKLAPLLTLLGTARGADAGSMSEPDNSGYRRLLIAPGLEWNTEHFRIYAEVELPVYEYYNGNQLAAPVLYKLATNYVF